MAGASAGRGRLRLPAPILEGTAASAAGAGLYAGAALLENQLVASPVLSAGLEEIGKALVILAAGLLAMRHAARASRVERAPARRLRMLRLGAARGLSLGLVAAAVFAAVENIAYLAAFPETGVLARLAWSLPVHLAAALAEAVGAEMLLGRLARHAAVRPARPSRLVLAAAAWLLALCGAAGWHAGANLLAERGFTRGAFALGTVTAFALTALLLALFLRRAHIGGYLDAAES